MCFGKKKILDNARAAAERVYRTAGIFSVSSASWNLCNGGYVRNEWVAPVELIEIGIVIQGRYTFAIDTLRERSKEREKRTVRNVMHVVVVVYREYRCIRTGPRIAHESLVSHATRDTLHGSVLVSLLSLARSLWPIRSSRLPANSHNSFFNISPGRSLGLPLRPHVELLRYPDAR